MTMSGIRTALMYGLVALVAVILFSGIPLYVDWLWFDDLGYSEVFSKIISSKLLLAAASGVIFFLVVWGNAWFALQRSSNRLDLYTVEGRLPIFVDRVIRRGVEFIVLFGGILLAIMVALEAATHWQSWINFTNYVPFGEKDAVFGIDIGFYVFRLEFLAFLYRTVMLALLAAAVASAAILYLSRTVDFLAGKLKLSGIAAGQLGILIALITALQAVGFRLNAYSLLFSQGPTLFGVGYTDAHVRLSAVNVAMAGAVVGAVLVLIAARRRSLQLAIFGFLLAPAINLVIGGGVGALVQRLVVNPDELNKEAPYLARHIQATQKAYGLSSVDTKEANISGTLTRADLAKNKITLKSVRLWDYNPLKSAYEQLQEIQQFYRFHDVDIDRYTVNGVYRQVMLSVRELDKTALDENAKTWLNLRLKYTHGYGMTMSPVNEVTPEGLPQMFIENIPPVSSVGFEIKQPQVYFGERTDDHILVDTAVDEFDYPRGATGVQTRYKADSGIKVGGFFRRLALAMRFGELNMILPGNIRSESRLLMRRNIRERVQALAPFLKLDNDPYAVLDNGRIVWIQDAYTKSNNFPYSQPTFLMDRALDSQFGPSGENLNYVRNSVKIVTDAYTGKVTFYVFQADDPLLMAYRKAFPGVFKDRSQMPESLQSHIRYGEDLFRLQTYIYKKYHMSDVNQFYNQGDLWEIPQLEQSDQTGADTQGEMEPYYVMMKLPDSPNEEFILLMPYTRANKDNMVAWMAAKCDGADYGRLLLYEFAKGQQFYGPAQIQARANQDTEISEQMTLWNQQKSTVSRGNLLVIPIEKAVLYVEPIYLQSTNTKIPEFKRVIVALGNRVTMQPTLSEALSVLVGSGAGDVAASEIQLPKGIQSEISRSGPGVTGVDRSAIRRALNMFNQATEAQKRGDWAEYGRMQKELGNVLRNNAGQ